MMGQANGFYRYAPEKIPFAIERSQREGQRLFEVLNTRLKDHRDLAGLLDPGHRAPELGAYF